MSQAEMVLYSPNKYKWSLVRSQKGLTHPKIPAGTYLFPEKK